MLGSKAFSHTPPSTLIAHRTGFGTTVPSVSKSGSVSDIDSHTQNQSQLLGDAQAPAPARVLGSVEGMSSEVLGPGAAYREAQERASHHAPYVSFTI